MPYAQRLVEELECLKSELDALTGGNVSAAVSASREKIDEATKLLGSVIDDIQQLVACEEESIERFIAGRPVASIAAAFFAGMALGFVLGRR